MAEAMKRRGFLGGLLALAGVAREGKAAPAVEAGERSEWKAEEWRRYAVRGPEVAGPVVTAYPPPAWTGYTSNPVVVIDNDRPCVATATVRGPVVSYSLISPPARPC